MKPVNIGDLFLAQGAPAGMESAPAAPASTAPAPKAGEASMAQPAKDEGKPQQPPGCFGGGALGMVLPLVLMFVIFYFFLIRPQQKKQKEHQEMLTALRKGDRIVTTGGILGTVTGLTDQYAVIEIQEKVRMKILRSHIAGKQPGQSDPEKK
ncbi:MAG: preprotein translocase subunit YajC [Polyangia bacterium]|nr:preprotein translocase subunit YajC [Polyangia bacterium]